MRQSWNFWTTAVHLGVKKAKAEEQKTVDQQTGEMPVKAWAASVVTQLCAYKTCAVSKTE